MLCVRAALDHCWITGVQSERNIHATVSEQLKKNFAKSRWKVTDWLNLAPFLLHHYRLVNTFYSCVFIKLSYLSNNFSSALFWNYNLNFLGVLNVLCLCTMEFKIFKFYLKLDLSSNL